MSPFKPQREDVIEAVKAVGEGACAYASHDPWPHRCDCKFGFTLSSTMAGERNGCPELATVLTVLENLTDDGWLTLLSTPGDTPLFQQREAFERRRFNELPRHLQAEAAARTGRRVWEEIFSGTLRFSGEAFELADFQKRFNAVFDRYVGEVIDDDRVRNEVRRDAGVAEVANEEFERRLWAQPYVVVPREAVVLRG